MWRECAKAETRASAAIEEEFRQELLDDHLKALERSLREKPSRRSLLKMHKTLAARMFHAKPGQYRTVNVRVGNHRGAEHREVPRLMNALFEYLEKSADNPIVRAAWGHAQFETVHPFADGNGRTGRAIISQMLQFPLPLSEWILDRRQEYYSMLGQGNWERYLDWFLAGIAEQGEKYQPTT